MDDRIKLAKAMGLEIYSRGADTYPLRKLHNNLMQPFSPLTDANDDYAVLKWMRSLEGNEKHNFHAPGPMFSTLTWDYKIGDYARAALEVLGRVQTIQPEREHSDG